MLSRDAQEGLSPTPQAVPYARKFQLTNMQARTLSVSVLIPTISYLICYSKFCTTSIVCFCMLCAGLEWSGVKRHLKVQLLLWSNNTNAKETLSKAVALSEAKLPTLVGGRDTNHDTLTTSELKQTLQHPVPHEYDCPVVQLSLYSILKHFGWTLLTISAHFSETAFLIVLTVFFLVFVAVTLIAHNRLELKVQEAADILSNQLYSKPPVESSDGVAMSPKQREAHQFRSMELLMITEKQPEEQFLDFSLDIFGIIWVSGLSFALFIYSKPQIGVRWAFGSTMSNFLNDICALLVGRSLKQWHARFRRTHRLDAMADGGANAVASAAGRASSKESASALRNGRAETHKKGEHPGEPNDKAAVTASPSVSGSGAAGAAAAAALASRERSDARSLTRFEQWVLRMPHPLCVAISPNKSLEGAIGGVLASSLSFTMCMYVMRPYDAVHMGKSVIAAHFDSVPVWIIVGLFMGAVGVMGDLLQSLLKRSAHLKDTGALIPGHGGILDRVDGMLLLYPFVFCTMSLFQALS